MDAYEVDLQFKFEWYCQVQHCGECPYLLLESSIQESGGIMCACRLQRRSASEQKTRNVTSGRLHRAQGPVLRWAPWAAVVLHCYSSSAPGIDLYYKLLCRFQSPDEQIFQGACRGRSQAVSPEQKPFLQAWLLHI